MPQNVKTPAGQGEGFGRIVASQADIHSIAPSLLEIQMRRLRARYGLSLAHASVVAEQAYAVPETWGCRV
ncbi:hypothetical protein CRT23_11250 [Methylobacterium sp. V23]|nr:hypothetical protein CRT23_11250 [Methylobacterium sp. V23]